MDDSFKKRLIDDGLDYVEFEEEEGTGGEKTELLTDNKENEDVRQERKA